MKTIKLCLMWLLASQFALAQESPNFDNGEYFLVAKHNNKTLDVGCDENYDPNGPNSRKDNVYVYQHHGGDNQTWQIITVGNGYYKLIAKHNGKALDVGCDDVPVAGQPNSKRDNVCAFVWHGNDNQLWKIEKLEDRCYRISAKHNGKALDVGCDDIYNPSQPNSKRDNVCVFPWHGNDNQRWKIVRK